MLLSIFTSITWITPPIAAYTVLIRELGDKDLTTCHIVVGILVATEKQATELAAYLKGSAQTRS